MPDALLVVDVQECFLNEYTQHIPARIAALIERGEHDPVLFTRFVNAPDSPFRRLLDWSGCAEPGETRLARELLPYVAEEAVFSKPGFAGLPDELSAHITERGFERIAIVGIDTDMCVLKVALDLFDLNIAPLVYTDCCASTHGLQSHLAGLAVLARNIGADRLLDAGLGGGQLAAPQ